jgi:hypothetical protein
MVTVNSFRGKGFTANRGERSRRGKLNLVRRNVRTSLKCECKASYTRVSFKNDHSDLDLPDPHMDNDGYVFNSGLSPAKKSSIISCITDMLSEYGTTAAAARKQIEQSLVITGDTGFGSGIVCILLR